MDEGIKGDWANLQNAQIWFAAADSGTRRGKYGDDWTYGTRQTERYARLLQVYMFRNEQFLKTAPELYAKLEATLDEIVPYIAMLRDTRETARRQEHGDIYDLRIIEEYLQDKVKSSPEKKTAMLEKEWYSGGEDKVKSKGVGGMETSIMQMPTGMNRYVEWGIAVPGGFHLNNGAGKYDIGQIELSKQGVTEIPMDPFNRSEKRNQQAYNALKEHGGAASAKSSNVLNVIRDYEEAI